MEASALFPDKETEESLHLSRARTEHTFEKNPGLLPFFFYLKEVTSRLLFIYLFI